jgi:hypothetical protein
MFSTLLNPILYALPLPVGTISRAAAFPVVVHYPPLHLLRALNVQPMDGIGVISRDVAYHANRQHRSKLPSARKIGNGTISITLAGKTTRRDRLLLLLYLNLLMRRAIPEMDIAAAKIMATRGAVDIPAVMATTMVMETAAIIGSVPTSLAWLRFALTVSMLAQCRPFRQTTNALTQWLNSSPVVGVRRLERGRIARL